MEIRKFDRDQLEEMDSPKEPKKKESKVVIFIMLLAIVIVVVAIVKIVIILLDYRADQKVYQKLKEDYVTENVVEQSQQKNPWYEMITVDMEGLQKVNPDIVGWLYFENEDISYPILNSGDNDTYLRTNYLGESANAGSIFMDGSNAPDFSDAHTLIYGHNMKDLTMFGRLKYYKTDESYYEDHQYFQIITKNDCYRYRIISCKDVTDTDDIYMIYRDGNNDFCNFVNHAVTAGSYIVPPCTVSDEDHIVTLSTCSNGDNRFVVSAIRDDSFAITSAH